MAEDDPVRNETLDMIKTAIIIVLIAFLVFALIKAGLANIGFIKNLFGK